MKLDKFETEVRKERARQNDRWGEQNHHDGTGETFIYKANTMRKRCDGAFAANMGTWKHILEEEVYEAFAESNPEKLKEELIQVAAVCKAWVECIDRRTKRND